MGICCSRPHGPEDGRRSNQSSGRLGRAIFARRQLARVGIDDSDLGLERYTTEDHKGPAVQSKPEVSEKETTSCKSTVSNDIRMSSVESVSETSQPCQQIPAELVKAEEEVAEIMLCSTVSSLIAMFDNDSDKEKIGNNFHDKAVAENVEHHVPMREKTNRETPSEDINIPLCATISSLIAIFEDDSNDEDTSLTKVSADRLQSSKNGQQETSAISKTENQDTTGKHNTDKGDRLPNTTITNHKQSELPSTSQPQETASPMRKQEVLPNIVTQHPMTFESLQNQRKTISRELQKVHKKMEPLLRESAAISDSEHKLEGLTPVRIYDVSRKVPCKFTFNKAFSPKTVENLRDGCIVQPYKIVHKAQHTNTTAQHTNTTAQHTNTTVQHTNTTVQHTNTTVSDMDTESEKRFTSRVIDLPDDSSKNKEADNIKRTPISKLLIKEAHQGTSCENTNLGKYSKYHQDIVISEKKNTTATIKTVSNDIIQLRGNRDILKCLPKSKLTSYQESITNIDGNQAPTPIEFPDTLDKVITTKKTTPAGCTNDKNEDKTIYEKYIRRGRICKMDKDNTKNLIKVVENESTSCIASQLPMQDTTYRISPSKVTMEKDNDQTISKINGNHTNAGQSTSYEAKDNGVNTIPKKKKDVKVVQSKEDKEIQNTCNDNDNFQKNEGNVSHDNAGNIENGARKNILDKNSDVKRVETNISSYIVGETETSDRECINHKDSYTEKGKKANENDRDVKKNERQITYDIDNNDEKTENIFSHYEDDDVGMGQNIHDGKIGVKNCKIKLINDRENDADKGERNITLTKEGDVNKAEGRITPDDDDYVEVSKRQMPFEKDNGVRRDERKSTQHKDVDVGKARHTRDKEDGNQKGKINSIKDRECEVEKGDIKNIKHTINKDGNKKDISKIVHNREVNTENGKKRMDHDRDDLTKSSIKTSNAAPCSLVQAIKQINEPSETLNTPFQTEGVSPSKSGFENISNETIDIDKMQTISPDGKRAISVTDARKFDNKTVAKSIAAEKESSGIKLIDNSSSTNFCSKPTTKADNYAVKEVKEQISSKEHCKNIVGKSDNSKLSRRPEECNARMEKTNERNTLLEDSLRLVSTPINIDVADKEIETNATSRSNILTASVNTTKTLKTDTNTTAKDVTHSDPKASVFMCKETKEIVRPDKHMTADSKYRGNTDNANDVVKNVPGISDVECQHVYPKAREPQKLEENDGHKNKTRLHDSMSSVTYKEGTKKPNESIEKKQMTNTSRQNSSTKYDNVCQKKKDEPINTVILKNTHHSGTQDNGQPSKGTEGRVIPTKNSNTQGITQILHKVTEEPARVASNQINVDAIEKDTDTYTVKYVANFTANTTKISDNTDPDKVQKCNSMVIDERVSEASKDVKCLKQNATLCLSANKIANHAETVGTNKVEMCNKTGSICKPSGGLFKDKSNTVQRIDVKCPQPHSIESGPSNLEQSIHENIIKNLTDKSSLKDNVKTELTNIDPEQQRQSVELKKLANASGHQQNVTGKGINLKASTNMMPDIEQQTQSSTDNMYAAESLKSHTGRNDIQMERVNMTKVNQGTDTLETILPCINGNDTENMSPKTVYEMKSDSVKVTALTKHTDKGTESLKHNSIPTDRAEKLIRAGIIRDNATTATTANIRSSGLKELCSQQSIANLRKNTVNEPDVFRNIPKEASYDVRTNDESAKEAQSGSNICKSNIDKTNANTIEKKIKMLSAGKNESLEKIGRPVNFYEANTMGVSTATRLSAMFIEKKISMTVAKSIEKINTHEKGYCDVPHFVRPPTGFEPRLITLSASPKMIKEGFAKRKILEAKCIMKPNKSPGPLSLEKKRSKMHIGKVSGLVDSQEKRSPKWAQKEGPSNMTVLSSVPQFYEAQVIRQNVRERMGLQKLQKYKITIQCKAIEKIKTDENEFPGILPEKFYKKWRAKMDEQKARMIN